MKKWLSTLLLLFSLTLASSAWAGSVKLATLDWEPYISHAMPGNGFVAEVVREAFKRQGQDAKFEFMPWARVVAVAKKGEVDGYLPEYYAKELEKDFLLSDPFPAGPLGFFKLKSKAITWKTLDDLKPYSIGVVRGYVNTAEFDARKDLKKDEVDEDTLNLRKLVAGRIDLMVADKYVGLYLAKKDIPGDASKIEFMSPVLENKELFVCFPKSKPGSKALRDAFNQGLSSMKADGTLKAIMQKNGF
ncbi:MAG: transporter substrate-binding domain-containing protein [Humidesulfovibrio sp.]|uniref:substrate-binding periplasmic protein n=1 Tax=Humidesulfovibrio sp. TaxID=2910988 RepID=UPI0027F4C473|nr:transporter substrate-binding domain-containing protein [Humidesulfovibrio sp.]MDQ7836385.1 transporter substrate-binding domain-containing protein [Humidesulfovibrio sp.]